ncbi:DNA-binding helix-turn-helix protein [Bordetella bronchiseptica GA96-01]|uniref:helix-turn-helix domain-containing protein n=1 Tax=Bordetella bronchiseptica TaxID=518 RepID=UPI00045A1A41|nr:AraC family transcriptional regulator [Bordetella bronchiseptica]AZW33159.1 AraC family transcriptional regulator [Bordetella bronchiseptica]KCV43684.1 DNA-binding helix-turn-helix protein [Bordetella bronchiseptica 345]KDC39535.1 DNA-binding helix-turn-helix protein [Bordetella bronchiseptica GA96-01]
METATFGLRSYRGETSRHAHPCHHQLILPRGGGMLLSAAGREGRVTGAWGALVPAGESHAFQADTGAAFLVLDLPAAASPFDTDTLQRLGEQVFFPLPPAAWHLAEAAGAQAAHAPHRLADAWRDWAALLSQALGDARPPRPAAVLARLRACVEAELARPLTVAELARRAGVSERTLQAVCRAELGVGPHGYVMQRRLARARALLAQTALPLAEVAAAAGYADQSALARAVRAGCGMTPLQYRRGQRG